VETPFRYAPLSRRNRLIFSAALLAMVVSVAALGSARFSLIGWWFRNCNPERNSACGAAILAIDYWWVALLAVVGVIAVLAHFRTIDRLTPIE
jgi:NADH:ubiquinone oxidoreductase subunit 5 (subunit L)/multisubunit Na+/H+ antiporter MnhA subunit